MATQHEILTKYITQNTLTRLLVQHTALNTAFLLVQADLMSLEPFQYATGHPVLLLLCFFPKMIVESEIF